MGIRFTTAPLLKNPLRSTEHKLRSTAVLPGGALPPPPGSLETPAKRHPHRKRHTNRHPDDSNTDPLEMMCFPDGLEG